MAEISLNIVGTDEFLNMSAASQVLYFRFAIEADNNGFVANPKRILELVKCSDADLQELISKDYIIKSDSGIYVKTDCLNSGKDNISNG